MQPSKLYLALVQCKEIARLETVISPEPVKEGDSIPVRSPDGTFSLLGTVRSVREFAWYDFHGRYMPVERRTWPDFDTPPLTDDQREVLVLGIVEQATALSTVSLLAALRTHLEREDPCVALEQQARPWDSLAMDFIDRLESIHYITRNSDERYELTRSGRKRLIRLRTMPL